jgi:hypothetical protein
MTNIDPERLPHLMTNIGHLKRGSYLGCPKFPIQRALWMANIVHPERISLWMANIVHPERISL